MKVTKVTPAAMLFVAGGILAAVLPSSPALAVCGLGSSCLNDANCTNCVGAHYCDGQTGTCQVTAQWGEICSGSSDCPPGAPRNGLRRVWCGRRRHHARDLL
jgi:hypothetical protein